MSPETVQTLILSLAGVAVVVGTVVVLRETTRVPALLAELSVLKAELKRAPARAVDLLEQRVRRREARAPREPEPARPRKKVRQAGVLPMATADVFDRLRANGFKVPAGLGSKTDDQVAEEIEETELSVEDEP